MKTAIFLKITFIGIYTVFYLSHFDENLLIKIFFISLFLYLIIIGINSYFKYEDLIRFSKNYFWFLILFLVLILHSFYLNKRSNTNYIQKNYIHQTQYEEIKNVRFQKYFYGKIKIEDVIYPGVYAGDLEIYQIKNRKQNSGYTENKSISLPLIVTGIFQIPQKNLFENCVIDVFFYGKVFFFPIQQRNQENSYFNFLISKLENIYGKVGESMNYYYFKLTEKNVNHISCELNEKNKIKSKIYSIVMNSILKMEQKMLVLGLVFGNSNWAKPELKKLIKELGLLHLFAASGLHLGILFGVFYIPLSKFLGKKHILALIIPLPFLFFYLYLLDFSFSLVRAYIFLIIYVLQLLFHRVSEPLETILNTLIIMILIFPFSVYNLSTALSFAAVSGILLFYKDLHSHFVQEELFPNYNKYQKIKIKIYQFILTHFFISITASLFIQPILFYFFKGNSVISLPVNIIFVPSIGFLLPFIFLMIGLSLGYDLEWSFLNLFLDVLWMILKKFFDLISLFFSFMSDYEFYLSFRTSLNAGFFISIFWGIIVIFTIRNHSKLSQNQVFWIIITSTIIYNLLIFFIFLIKV